MSLFRSVPKSKRVLIFHIGSGGIIAADVLFESQTKDIIPEILTTAVFQMPVDLELSGTKLIETMLRTLKKSAEHMVSQNIGSPNEIICFLESPWYVAQARTIRSAKNTPFQVTEKLVKELIKKETELFDREELAGYRESGSESIIVEREITDIRFNGYSVTEPYGKKVREISINLIFSVSPKELISQIQTTISSVFHRTSISFRTFAYAGSTITRDLFTMNDSFLFADIGGEMTDIVLVKENAYTEAISFPWGTHSLLRAIADKSSISIDEARSILSLYTSGKMEAGLQRKIEKTLDTIMQAWTQNFGQALSKLATRFGIPHTIALIIEPAMLPFFKQAIMNESSIQHTLTTQSFSIVPLSEIPWTSFARHASPAHPRSTIAALLVAKHMSK